MNFGENIKLKCQKAEPVYCNGFSNPIVKITILIWRNIGIPMFDKHISMFYMEYRNMFNECLNGFEVI